jgi:serine phosphatase RsbU (regulator of sigma subunit)/Tfp pilus assembly protein PilF
MKFYSLFLFFIFFSILCFSQFKRDIDSFLYVNEKLKDTDTAKINNLYEVANSYYKFSPDSAIIYANKVIELSENISYIKGVADGNKVIGTSYYLKSDFQNALIYYLKALEIYEDLQDIKNIGAINNNVGNIYLSSEKYDLAYKYYNDAKKAFEILKDEKRLSSAYLNLGSVFDQLNILDSAFYYFNLSLELRNKNNDKKGAAGVYNNIGFVFLKQKKYEEAIKYFEPSIEIYISLDDKFNLPITYSNIADCYINTNRYELGYQYIQKGLVIVREIGAVKTERDLVLGLYDYYYRIGEYKKSVDAHILYVELKDSVFNEEINEQLTDMQTKYETEKQQKEIELLEANQEKNKLTIERQRLIVLIAIILLLSFFVFSVLIYRSNNQRKKAYNLLQLKNVEILQQKVEIITQNDTLLQQKEEIQVILNNLESAYSEISIQKNEIEKAHKSITHSINYAKRIQKAIITNPELKLFLPFEHFIFFKPRDIVSGDFYFIRQIEKITIIAAADCTGHGVPGAFMSMLGITLLNEIIKNKHIKTSSQVLDELRIQIKLSLQQTGQKGEQQDGMDIAFCAINNENLELSFAGANNPCWIIRNLESNNNELITLEADRQPIGIYIKEKPFTEHTFQLKKNDTIYLFSDGYHSQFGGENRQSLKISNFRNIISEIISQTIDNQRLIIETKLSEWKSDNEQTDDILVIGVRV